MKKKPAKASTRKQAAKPATHWKAYSVVKDAKQKVKFVLVPYAVWQSTEKLRRAGKKRSTTTLKTVKKSTKTSPWENFAGVLGDREDGLTYQKRMRDEWQ